MIARCFFSITTGSVQKPLCLIDVAKFAALEGSCSSVSDIELIGIRVISYINFANQRFRLKLQGNR